MVVAGCVILGMTFASPGGAPPSASDSNRARSSGPASSHVGQDAGPSGVSVRAAYLILTGLPGELARTIRNSFYGEEITTVLEKYELLFDARSSTESSSKHGI